MPGRQCSPTFIISTLWIISVNSTKRELTKTAETEPRYNRLTYKNNRNWDTTWKPTTQKTHGGCSGKVRQWWKATKTTELWNAMWPEDPLHTQTHTPSRVLKKTFSASFVPRPAENHTYNSIILCLIIPQQTFQPFGVCKIQIFF